MTTDQPLILAVETTTSKCSVALMQGERLLSQQTITAQRRHNEILPGMVGQLFKWNDSSQARRLDCLSHKDIELVAVSIGPGSFTGLRVGLSYAKGFAIAVNAPVIPVETLSALAHQLSLQFCNNSETIFCPLIVARKGEAFGQLFAMTDSRIEPITEPFFGGAEQIIAESEAVKHGDMTAGRGICFAGEGADMLYDQLSGHLTDGSRIIKNIEACAIPVGMLGLERWIHSKGDVMPLREIEPLYLKEFTIKNRRSS
ncbi:MAG: tRNA (adenosine(37)-N6)-threonylcarbamoyltransferase complex dimerization subunit type 1 TsaB [Candidatus Electryoneaceae bacterium]|nr:tRNA (adenosine(37)-N6)-threonylcarbamoyltransferase complex dimerization subunit type 1 TsaB [Candidatus Electryoneaceae bacterium]